MSTSAFPLQPAVPGDRPQVPGEKIEKYESREQPGLFFWAEANGDGAGAVESYCVVSQVTGYPATEAHDDWFANFKDADEIARMLAAGEPV